MNTYIQYMHVYHIMQIFKVENFCGSKIFLKLAGKLLRLRHLALPITHMHDSTLIIIGFWNSAAMEEFKPINSIPWFNVYQGI